MAKSNPFSFVFLAGFAGLIYWLWSQMRTETGYADMTGQMFPANSLTTSQQGKDNIQRWEGFEHAAYKDIAGNWTIGVGHLIVPSDGLTPQSILTDGQVYDLFANDLTNAEHTVKSLVSVPITQGMFDALADFAFQFGYGNETHHGLSNSTLLRLLNLGDYNGAAAELPKWVHSGNQIIAQLVDRRDVAQQMFMA